MRFRRREEPLENRLQAIVDKYNEDELALVEEPKDSHGDDRVELVITHELNPHGGGLYTKVHYKGKEIVHFYRLHRRYWLHKKIAIRRAKAYLREEKKAAQGNDKTATTVRVKI